MKSLVKKIIGRCVVAAAERWPRARPRLRRLGVRTSEDLFGERAVSIPTPQGRSLQLTHLDDSYLSFQLFWHGLEYYEPLTRALLEALVRPGDTFLDVGAHIGFYSLTLGLAVGSTRIIAFEPNPKNLRILQANVAANGLTNIVCEPLAISDCDGAATLYLTESDMSASLMKGFQAEDTQQIGSLEVQTTSLDSYLAKRRIEGALILKVDIEGHEPAFFRGAARTLAARRPDIILEVLYEPDPALVAQLKSLGYRFYPITDEGLVELEAPKLIKRYPFLFLNHLLSVRPKPEVAELFRRVGQATRGIDLLQTSKHFPKSEWPALWENR